MKMALSKYELWNALFMSPDREKSEKIDELVKELNVKMGKPGLVIIDIREEE